MGESNKFVPAYKCLDENISYKWTEELFLLFTFMKWFVQLVNKATVK